MVAAKFLFLAMAACIQATPVVTAPYAATTQWKALPIPKDKTDWTNIDMDAFQNPANWKHDGTVEKLAWSAANATLSTRAALSGPCEQGDCPDYSAAFDLVYSFVAVPVPGDPPLTIFEGSSAIRINDCGQCLYHKVGSSVSDSVPGGCYDYNSCGRDQQICVDPGNTRAHRIWKDLNVKTCYHMAVEYLGGYGPVKSRVILHPDAEVACNW